MVERHSASPVHCVHQQLCCFCRSIHSNVSFCDCYKLNNSRIDFCCYCRPSVSTNNALAGEADTVFPCIAKMDENNNFSELEDPNNVFQCESVEGMAATNDGSMLFIYCDKLRLYTWDEQNYFKLLQENKNLTSPFQVDSQNNLFSATTIDYLSSEGTRNCIKAVLNASSEYSCKD